MAFDRGGSSPAQLLLAALSDAAVTVDGAGRVSAWNAAALHRFDLEGDGALGRRPEELAGGPLAGVMRLPMEPGGSFRELIVWPADGVAQGDMVRLQREDALGRIAGGISHDLKNSLGSIGMLSSLVSTEPGMPPDLRDSARLLQDEADRTLRIIRTLLEVTRHRPPEVTNVPLGPLVRETVELAHASLANVALRITVPETLPHVATDASLLRRAILALTLNAIEAMGGRWDRTEPRASGRLHISARLVDDPEPRMRLAIEDGAAPVPEASRPYLFADDPAPGNPRGGRDLAAAQALITAAGGRLRYETAPDGNGNRFVVDLPVTARLEADTTPRRRAGGVAGGLAGAVGGVVGAGVSGAGVVGAAPGLDPTRGPRSSGTVLVCDDEAYIRVLLVRVIERTGYRAVEATGGHEALERLAGERVDMVIADQRMLGMSGVELYHAVAALHPDLRTRFVLMSGDPGSAELVALAADTGVGVIGKPFDFERIGTLIRETIEA
jgi:CheY-like chemotaxis protein